MITAVICCYNGEKWLDNLLSLLHEMDYISHIICVYNPSTDNTLNILSNWNEYIDLIENDYIMGFGPSNNIAFKLIRTKCNDRDNILLINQDALIAENDLVKLDEELKSNDNIGIISPVHFDIDGQVDHKFSRYLDRNTYEVNGITHRTQGKRSVEVDFVNAAIWLLKREVIEVIGGFNPLFDHYGEDEEYVNRLKYNGYSIVVSLDSTGIHDRKPIPESKSRFYKNLFYRGSLVTLLDPNQKFYLSIISVTKELYIVYRKFTFNKRYGLIREYLKIWVNMICIYRYYQQNKKSGSKYVG